ncbi:MAG: hypothetical protein LBC59_07670 [Chitinispirillales bacterium]|jgi:hypothetical protein|nr:hypothetical protein [Chitinispirillales bacterium]
MRNCNEYGGSPRNSITAGSLFAALSFVVFVLFPHTASATGVVSPQVFTRGSIVYVVDQKQITYFSMDTRSARMLYSSVDSLFDIVGAVRNGDMIWASNGMGAVIAVNMQTGTLEDFSLGFVVGGGYIDVDRRFVWLAMGDTLYRMDLTSREWVKIAIPSKSALTVRGLMSFNDQVHVVTSGAVYILTTASGDWVTVPHKDFTLAAGDVRRVGDAVYFTQDKVVYRYDPSKRLFVGAVVKERIRAASFSQSDINVVAGNRVYTFNERNFSLEPGPAIPVLRNVNSIARDSVTQEIICATDMGLVTYTTPFNLWVTRYPDHVTVDGGAFVFRYNDHIMLYKRGGFIVYNPDRKLWSSVRIRNRSDVVRKGPYSWDEDGAHVTFSDKYVGTPGGTATFRGAGGVEYADTGDLVINPPIPLANVTLNLRTEDTDGRILDLTIDNAATTLPPQKGFYYKGIDDDIFSRASFGVQGTGLSRSNVNSDVVTEGASAVFSGTTAYNGNRSLVTATAGSGYLLSKTKWRAVWYEPSGLYYIRGVEENREVVASTVKMYVDGIPLPSTDFVYNPGTRAVRLIRRDKTNPKSVIQLAFSERHYPAERQVFEPLPEDNLGQYNFVEGAVSPREWMRARAGLLTVDRGDSGGFSSMALAGIPMEWRGAGGRSILFYPEIAYDNRLGAHSASVTAGVTEGRAFGSYSGRWVGRDFMGLDKPTFSYRDMIYEDMNNEHEINLGYDIRDNLRAGIYQVHRRTEYNNLSNFELRTSYTGDYLPDIEVSAAGLFSENNPGLETSKRNQRETFSLRLSDLSVRSLREMKVMHNVGYDFSWSEYISNTSERGRVAYGMVNVSPISSLTLTGTTVYHLNPSDWNVRSDVNPQVSVNTRDLPRGFDVNASYSVFLLNLVDYESDTMYADGNINGYFYPGEYVKNLERVALYASLSRGTKTWLPTGAQPMKFALFPQDDLLTYKWTQQEVGLLFFPIDNLLLSTLNSRSCMDNGEINYNTNERLGLWLQNGSKLEAGAGARKSGALWRISTDALYEHRWGNGLITGAGAFGSRLTDKDSSAVEAGPIITASLVKELSGYIRSIENSHYLRLTLLRGDGAPVPDIAYALYFRLKMLPDISVVAELGAGIQGQKTATVGAGAYLHAGF